MARATRVTQASSLCAAPAPSSRKRCARPVAASLRLYSRRIESSACPERCFVSLFSDSETAFWLDSSLIRPGLARFSFMGDASGPLSEVISYDVRRRQVLRRTVDGRATTRESIFDALKRWSEERVLEGPNQIPVPFSCGWVGYLGYELKEDCGASRGGRSDLPDAQLVFADRVIAFDHQEGAVWLLCWDESQHFARVESWFRHTEALIRGSDSLVLPAQEALHSLIFHPHRNRAAYSREIAKAKHAIRCGESYEICLTNEFVAEGQIDPVAAYRQLRRASPAPHAAFLRFGKTAVLSSSPERFIRIDAGGWIEAKPIKGTIRRGSTAQEDADLAEALRSSVKDRAENLMIVDLLRNDLGRVSEVGSVFVPILFGIETFATVHQLVSRRVHDRRTEGPHDGDFGWAGGSRARGLLRRDWIFFALGRG
jgi:para-aminobenzoate synthetase